MAAKLTQTEVAAAVGKSRQTINAWEREEEDSPTPDESDLAKLADLYGRPVRDLRYSDLAAIVSEPRPVSYSSLPKHLVALAAKFEIEALEMGADEPMMRYIAQALRSPESVTMFRMGFEGRELTEEEQVKYLESHIAKLRALVKERVKQRRTK